MRRETDCLLREVDSNSRSARTGDGFRFAHRCSADQKIILHGSRERPGIGFLRGKPVNTLVAPGVVTQAISHLGTLTGILSVQERYQETQYDIQPTRKGQLFP